MNTILEAQPSSTADPTLLQPTSSVSNTGKSVSKELVKSRLSVCTVNLPHSPAAATYSHPPWDNKDSPGPSHGVPSSSSVTADTPGSAATASSSSIATTDADGAHRAAGPGTPGAASRSSYTAVASELLAASSSPHSPLAAASPKLSRDDRSELLNSPGSSSSSSSSSQPGASFAADGALEKLLVGKIPRARSSLAQTTPAAAAVGAAAVPVSNSSSSGSHVLADRATASGVTPTPAVAGRLSLANVGLLAAPGAGLLPGSPLADAAATAAASAAALFGSSTTSTGRTSTAAAGSTGRQSQLTQRDAGCGGGLAGALGAAGQERSSAAGSSARRSSGGVGIGEQLLHYQQQQQQVSKQPQAAAAAAPQQRTPWVQGSKGAAQQAAGASLGADDDEASSSQAAQQQCSAAFKATSREQANRIGRIKAAAEEVPGPAHYQPHHSHTDKHVHVAHIVQPSSRPSSPDRTAGAAEASIRAAAPRSSLTQQQQQQGMTVTSLSLGAKAAMRLSNTAAAGAARFSLADTTPRGVSEAAGPDTAQSRALGGVQPHHVHARPKPQQGTSAFKAVSREQLHQRQQQQQQRRPASAGPSAAGSASGAGGSSSSGGVAGCSSSGAAAADDGSSEPGSRDYFREGYAHLTRPRSSRGPVAIFAKQTSRPATACITDCPRALGPGAYHRSGQLPGSYMGADVAAGHKGSSTAGSCVLEFDKYSSRPGTCPAAVGGSRDGGSTGSMFEGTTGAAGVDWPGVWGWAAAADGCVSQSGHLTNTFTSREHASLLEAPEGQGEKLQLNERPSSRAALAYARSQGPTDLVAPQHACVCEASADGASGFIQQLQRQQRPVSTGRKQHIHSAACKRPATAGAVLVGGPGSLLGTCNTGWAATNSSSKAGVLGPQELQRYSSTGFASQVKGGSFSTGSRAAAAKVLRAMSVGSIIPPASVAVVQHGTELAYEPNPEVLGHMHRSPGWKLPPNRIATSKKWAQLASKAALQ